MSRPDDLKYTSTHEWVRPQGDSVVVGITDHAVAELSDLAFIDLPEVGEAVEKGSRFGEIESTKAVSDLLAPVSGEIMEVNTAATENLQEISSSPFDKGWMVRIRMSHPSELDSLLSAEEYEAHLKAVEH
jgi:glycine cleavage system H protein